MTSRKSRGGVARVVVAHERAPAAKSRVQESGVFTKHDLPDEVGGYGLEAPEDEQAGLGALDKAVNDLPDRERFIVVMHYFDGLRMKDIGHLLGVSEPRVSQLHARAVKRLKGLTKID